MQENTAKVRLTAIQQRLKKSELSETDLQETVDVNRFRQSVVYNSSFNRLAQSPSYGNTEHTPLVR